MLKKWAVIPLLWLAGLSAAIYAADDLWARYRNKPVVEVRTSRDFARRNSWRRSEYVIASPEGETSSTCIQAMLPHFGFPPCWYLFREAIPPADSP